MNIWSKPVYIIHLIYKKEKKKKKSLNVTLETGALKHQGALLDLFTIHD